ncbi:hypothetical protein CBR_g29568 [Chara braunii]|uniref:DUF4455 domain-containing protein n=1 Tax=Chara braunii TaxID=69332 RepID=A0A388LAT5_CHABU|nr:hypothetical protein CBR_g29568 [Chara braunii]|eukprot:GBG79421.1 hypothetical protein CBR_g29568 [Chara braunii]
MVTDGKIERQVEEESLSVDRTILINRRAHADLLKKLKLREVQLESERLELWEKSFIRWRSLKAKFKIDQFKLRLATDEFAAPPQRQSMLHALQGDQERTYQTLTEQYSKLQSILPPSHFSESVATRWGTHLKIIANEWLERVVRHCGRLKEQEVEIDKNAQGLYVLLEEDVRKYEENPTDSTVASLQVSELMSFIGWQSYLLSGKASTSTGDRGTVLHAAYHQFN